MKSEREVLEVHIQKGAPDNHKVTFRGKADEHPEADCGDVIFVLKETEHKDFKRKGADLFIERKISLVEALCGFELEITHLDGRKLLCKTSPGELVKPMPRGFDPLESKENTMEWDVFEDCDCPSIDNIAQADTTDVDTLKKACETQLKRKGIDVGAFVVTASRAHFKQASREECMVAKKAKKGTTMYVVKDPNAVDNTRLMKAIKDEGMPTFKNPFVHGNLFVILSIEFPESLSADAQASIRKVLPPALNRTSLSPDDEGVEQHFFADIDPVASFNANKINMQVSGDSAYDDDDDGGRMGGHGQAVQCQQQ
jgi:DnaJ-class molecular chaperone